MKQKYTFYPTDSHDIIGVIHKFPHFEVTCHPSSQYSDDYKCENAITAFEDTHFCSGHSLEDKAFLEISLGTTLTITNYSVQATDVSSRSDWQNPSAWELYGINGDKEELIDTVTNSGLKTSFIIKTFAVDKIGSFNKFKILLTTVYSGSGGGENVLRIQQIDFFGTILTDLKSCWKVPFRSHQGYLFFVLNSLL